MADDSDALIDKAIETFEKDLPKLMETDKGRWVSYVGDRRIVIGDDKDEVLKRSYQEGIEDKELFVARIAEDMGPERGFWEVA